MGFTIGCSQHGEEIENVQTILEQILKTASGLNDTSKLCAKLGPVKPEALEYLGEYCCNQTKSFVRQ